MRSSRCSPAGCPRAAATAWSPASAGCWTPSSAFRFDEEALGLLRRHGSSTRPRWSGWPATASPGDVWGYAEGEPTSPTPRCSRSRRTFAEAVLLETLLLSVSTTTPRSPPPRRRMTWAAGDRPCSRWARGAPTRRPRWPPPARRTSPASPRPATSRPARATASHHRHQRARFTLLHDDERDAFAAQVAALGAGTTLLVDTYDVAEAVRLAVEVAGTGLGAVRIDSGDLAAQARQVRAQLDALGATATRIVVTGDLDEHAIARSPSAGRHLRRRHHAGRRRGHPTCGLRLQAGGPRGRRRRAGPGGQAHPGKARSAAASRARRADQPDGSADGRGPGVGAPPPRRRRTSGCCVPAGRAAATSSTARAAGRGPRPSTMRPGRAAGDALAALARRAGAPDRGAPARHSRARSPEEAPMKRA